MKDTIPGRRALLLGFLALCILGLGILGMTAFQRQAHSEIEKALRTQHKLSALLERQQDAETGRRGYELTGEPAFLEPLVDAQAGFSQDLAELERYLADDQPRLAAIRRVRQLSSAHNALLADTLARHAAGGAIEPSAMDRAKMMTDEMRSIILLQAAAQEERLQQQSRMLKWRSSGLYLALFLINLWIIGLFVLVSRNMQQRLAQAIAMQDALKTANAEIRAEAQRREQVERRLHHLQKMEAIGRLSSVIAHDFKNMITGIVMALGNARMRMSGQDQAAQEDIDLALQGTSRATDLANRLLTLSRQQPLHPRGVNINAVISGITDLLHRTIGRYLVIDLVLGEDLGTVMVDPEQLETAIINLCLNARDAMPAGGRITITTRNLTLHDAGTPRFPEAAPGDYVALSISDTGAGMTPEVAARAFDPFYSTKNDADGLGLSQVDGFVSQSGGHIRMFSTAGAGTTMKIILPRVADESEPALPQ